MINRHLKEYSTNLLDNKQIEKVKLRDDILILLSEYCANLSQDLWIEYNYSMVPQLLKLQWDNHLHLEFLQYKRLIDQRGLQAAGNAILLAFTALIKTNSQSKSNKH